MISRNLKKRILNLLKNLPILGPVFRYILDNFIQTSIGKKNATFFAYNKNFIENEELQITKINKNDSLYIAHYCKICDKWQFEEEPGEHFCRKCKVKLLK